MALLRVLLLATTASAYLTTPRLTHVVASPRSCCRVAAAPRMPNDFVAPTPLTIADASAVIPTAYNAAAAAIVVRAATRANSPAEVALLVATAALVTVDLGPTASRQLTSAKRADWRKPPLLATLPGGAWMSMSADEAMSKREAAKTWREAIHMKIFWHFLALYSTTRKGSALVGAALLFAASFGFWCMGAGAARHDEMGAPAPVDPKVVRIIASVDIALLATALFGAFCPHIGSLLSFVSHLSFPQLSLQSLHPLYKLSFLLSCFFVRRVIDFAIVVYLVLGHAFLTGPGFPFMLFLGSLVKSFHPLYIPSLFLTGWFVDGSLPSFLFISLAFLSPLLSGAGIACNVCSWVCAGGMVLGVALSRFVEGLRGVPPAEA